MNEGNAPIEQDDLSEPDEHDLAAEYPEELQDDGDEPAHAAGGQGGPGGPQPQGGEGAAPEQAAAEPAAYTTAEKVAILRERKELVTLVPDKEQLEADKGRPCGLSFAKGRVVSLTDSDIENLTEAEVLQLINDAVQHAEAWDRHIAVIVLVQGLKGENPNMA
eukprot:g2336.t1